MFDQYNELYLKSLEVPNKTRKTASFATDEVDLHGYNAATFAVFYGDSDDTLSGSVYLSAKLQESDTSGSGFTDVDADDVIGNTSNLFGLCNAPAEDSTIYKLGYKGTKRYVRIYVTLTGIHMNGIPVAAFVVLGKAGAEPVTAQANP